MKSDKVNRKLIAAYDLMRSKGMRPSGRMTDKMIYNCLDKLGFKYNSKGRAWN